MSYTIGGAPAVQLPAGTRLGPSSSPTCDVGQVAFGGGVEAHTSSVVDDRFLAILATIPNVSAGPLAPTSWTGTIINEEALTVGASMTMTVFVICSTP
jgi:hypothetical protein